MCVSVKYCENISNQNDAAQLLMHISKWKSIYQILCSFYSFVQTLQFPLVSVKFVEIYQAIFGHAVRRIRALKKLVWTSKFASVTACKLCKMHAIE